MVGAVRAEEADRVRRLRGLTLAERGEMLRAACRTAAVMAQSRAACGLPPAEPAPWPASTWEFLAACARKAREGATGPNSAEPSPEDDA